MYDMHGKAGRKPCCEVGMQSCVAHQVRTANDFDIMHDFMSPVSL